MVSKAKFIWHLKQLGHLMLISLVVTVAGYLLFAVIFSTDEEKQLARENRLYSKMYQEMLSREALVSDVVASLEIKDNRIFNDLFNTDAPPVDPVASCFDATPLDSMTVEQIVPYAASKSDALMAQTGRIDMDFAKILLMLSRVNATLPPMALPVDNMSYPQTGASVGMKYNPFYKTQVLHEGLDFMAPQGSPVHATADGVVTGAVKSVRGQGNYVVIEHAGGYVTKYAHLTEITVRVGEHVALGQQIGSVGRTGKSFAPHLHYEITRDGEILDPVNYLFGSIRAVDYANMLHASINTKQSMD